MTNLARKEGLFPDLFGFRREFDELFNNFLGDTRLGAERIMTSFSDVPPIEVWMDKEKKNYRARVALPGVESQNVQLNVQGELLSIFAERKENFESKDLNYLRREFSYGKIERTLTLPEGVEKDKIVAEFNNGVLEISAPVAVAALPRRIEVKTTTPKAKLVAA